MYIDLPLRRVFFSKKRGVLHFYYYNELHSSDYHYYDATYIYTIREKFDLQIYHI